MLQLLIRIIKLYQQLPLACHGYCRHNPTCSNYALIALKRYGVIKGLSLSVKRIIKCRPGGTAGYDPVP